MASPIPWTKIKVISFDVYGVCRLFRPDSTSPLPSLILTHKQTLIDWENGIATTARATALGPYLPKDHRDLMLAIEHYDLPVQKEFPTMQQSQIIAEGLRRYARDLKVVEDGKLDAEIRWRTLARSMEGRLGSMPLSRIR